MDEGENQINHLETKGKKNNQSEEEEEKTIQKNEGSISSLWDNFKRSNIRLIGVPEGEEEQQKIGNLFEKIVKENFPNLVKETDMRVQEVQRAPNKMDAKRPTPRHIKIKMPKVYRDNLKNSKRKEVSYRGVPISSRPLISQNKLRRIEETRKKYSKS